MLNDIIRPMFTPRFFVKYYIQDPRFYTAYPCSCQLRGRYREDTYFKFGCCPPSAIGGQYSLGSMESSNSTLAVIMGVILWNKLGRHNKASSSIHPVTLHQSSPDPELNIHRKAEYICDDGI